MKKQALWLILSAAAAWIAVMLLFAWALGWKGRTELL